MKRLGFLIVISVGLLVVTLQKDRIALYLFTENIEKLVSRDLRDELEDGIHVAFCGTGSPLPDLTRGGACTAVIAGKRVFLFDAGEGTAESLALMGILPSEVEMVFLTHFHSDHINGLGALVLQHVFRGNVATPLPVYGGPGVERVVNGFNEAFALDHKYRVAHHGAKAAPPKGLELSAFEVKIPEVGVRKIISNEGVSIEAFKVNHEPVAPAYGYRITYRGRTVVISGDTTYSENLVKFATDADLLVHEALAPQLISIIEKTAARHGRHGLEIVMRDIPGYHASPSDIVRVATASGVGALALTHVIPGLPGAWFDSLFTDGAEKGFNGEFWIMQDGDLISLPIAGGQRKANVY